MPLVPMRAILEATEKYNYAQGAFNVNAVAQAKAVIEVHEMFRSAAIIQGADLANAFMGGRTDFASTGWSPCRWRTRRAPSCVRGFPRPGRCACP